MEAIAPVAPAIQIDAVMAPVPPTPIPKAKRVVKKRSPSELQDYKLEVARKQNALRWGVDQLRATEADQQLESGARGIQLMDLPNEVLGLIFRPFECPLQIEYRSRGKDAWANPIMTGHATARCKCAHNYQLLCTTLCRRTYYLYRERVTHCEVHVTSEYSVRAYNQLKLRAARPDDWQEHVHTWTRMPLLRKLSYIVNQNVEYGEMKVYTRAAMPWLYVMALTTAEQRRSMTLRFKSYHQVSRFCQMRLKPELYLTILGFKRIKFCDALSIRFFLQQIDREYWPIYHYNRKTNGAATPLRWPLFQCKASAYEDDLTDWYQYKPTTALFCARMGLRFRLKQIVRDIDIAPARERKEYCIKQFQFPVGQSGPGGMVEPLVVQLGETELGPWR
jgi:hypothetical protein